MSTDDTDDDSWPRLSFADIEASMRKTSGINQRETLHLKPWQLPTNDFFYEIELLDAVLDVGPSEAVGSGEYERAVLAKRLLDNKLSLFEPNPERALSDAGYRKEIDARTRALAAANKDGLSDDVIAHVMKLAPYPLFRAEAECRAEFRRLLEQEPTRDFDACARAVSVTWQHHRERTRVYDKHGKQIKR